MVTGSAVASAQAGSTDVGWDDATLVARAREGDLRAFEALFSATNGGSRSWRGA